MKKSTHSHTHTMKWTTMKKRTHTRMNRVCKSCIDSIVHLLMNSCSFACLISFDLAAVIHAFYGCQADRREHNGNENNNIANETAAIHSICGRHQRRQQLQGEKLIMIYIADKSCPGPSILLLPQIVYVIFSRSVAFGSRKNQWCSETSDLTAVNSS